MKKYKRPDRASFVKNYLSMNREDLAKHYDVSTTTIHYWVHYFQIPKKKNLMLALDMEKKYKQKKA